MHHSSDWCGAGLVPSAVTAHVQYTCMIVTVCVYQYTALVATGEGTKHDSDTLSFILYSVCLQTVVQY